MKRLLPFLGFLALAAVLGTLIPISTPGQANQNVNVVGYTLTTDVCQNPTVPKTSVVINISSAATTSLVAPVTGEKVYVCNATLTMAGTAPSIEFETGTGATCGTSTAALTGTFAPTAGSILKTEGAGVQFSGIASGRLCAVTAGTGSPSFQGYLVEVQQ